MGHLSLLHKTTERLNTAMKTQFSKKLKLKKKLLRCYLLYEIGFLALYHDDQHILPNSTSGIQGRHH